MSGGPLDPSFADLMDRLRQRDEQAAAVVFERYSRRLIGLARARLDAKLRAKLDADDIVQSAYRTFFRRQAAGEFEFSGHDDLWRVLALITVRKCGRWRETFQAAKMAVAREVAPDFSSSDSIQRWEALGEEPTPEEAATLAETLEGLLASLPSDMHRQVLSMHLQGYSSAEIAESVGRTQATVRRVMALVREALARTLAREERGA